MSVQLVAWLLVSGLAAYLLRTRLLVSIIISITLWTLIPAVAGSIVTGVAKGTLSFHPATWFILITLVVQATLRPRSLTAVVAKHIFAAITLSLVVAVTILTTYITGSGGLALVADQMVGPVCLFLLVIAAANDRPDVVTTLRRTLLVLAGLVSTLAVVQWIAGDILVYKSEYSTRWWFVRHDFDRWMATLDHPLTLSLFLCTIGPLLAGIRRASLQIGLAGLMFAAILITQSRSGTIGFGLVVVYLISKARTTATTKLVLYGLAATSALTLATTALAGGVTARFEDDTGSTGARFSALGFFFDTWHQYAIVGHGFTSSYRFASQGGLITSLESSILMYSVDIGVVFALLYFGAQVFIVLRGIGNTTVEGLVLSGVVLLVLPQTYSALAAGSAVGMLLWAVLAMIVADGGRGLGRGARWRRQMAPTWTARSPATTLR